MISTEDLTGGSWEIITCAGLFLKSARDRVEKPAAQIICPFRPTSFIMTVIDGPNGATAFGFATRAKLTT